MTLAQPDCALTAPTSSEDTLEGAAAISQETAAGIRSFAGDTRMSRGTVQFTALSQSGQTTCAGSMSVTSGECLYSSEGPAAPSSDSMLGPCQMELQGPLPAQCSAMGSCLDSVSVAPKAGAVAQLTMNGADCYSALFFAAVRGGDVVLSFESKAGPAALVGSPAEPKGTVLFTLIADSDDDATLDDDGSWTDDTPLRLGAGPSPCQAKLRVTSGTCFFSDQGPNSASSTFTTTARSVLLACIAVAYVGLR